MSPSRKNATSAEAFQEAWNRAVKDGTLSADDYAHKKAELKQLEQSGNQDLANAAKLEIDLASLSPKLSNSTPHQREGGKYAPAHERQRIKSTGQVVEIDWAMAFTLRDGKIARFRNYEDTAAGPSARAGR